MPYKIDPKTGKKIQYDIVTGQPIAEEPTQPEVTQPKKEGGVLNFVKGVGKDIFETAVGLPKMILAVGEAGTDRARISKMEDELAELRKQPLTKERVAKEEELAKKMQDVAQINPNLMKQKDIDQLGEGTTAERLGKGALYGAKKGAGTASFLVPGGGGAATSVGGRIATAAGRSALSGAMAGFAQPTDELSFSDSLGNAAVGGATGLATGGIFQTGGEGVRAVRNLMPKVGNKMVKVSTAAEKSARAKSIGMNPAKKLGGAKLFDEMDSVGIVGNDADEVAESAAQILKQNSDDLINGVKKAGGGELEVSTKPLMKMLKEARAKAPAAKKAVYDKIIKEVNEDTGGKSTMKITDYYHLKQEYGAMGKWTMGSMFDETSAGVYESAYVHMNDVMDDALRATGNPTFRANNKAITIAIKALRYAEDASMKVSNQGINLYDTIAGATGFMAGGGVGGTVAMGANRVARSPKTQSAVARAGQRVGSKLASTSVADDLVATGGKLTRENIKKELGSAVKASIIPASTAVAMTQPEQPTMPEEPIADMQGMSTAEPDFVAEESDYTPITGHTVDEYLEAIANAQGVGDTKAVKYLTAQMGIEEEYEKRNKPTGEDGNVGKVSAVLSQLRTTGNQSLKGYEGLIFDESGKVDKSVIMAMKAKNPALVAGTETGQKARQAKAYLYRVAQSFLRIDTGAAAPDSEVRALAESLEPSIFDDADTIRTKLSIYANTFKAIEDLEGRTPSGGATFEDGTVPF